MTLIRKKIPKSGLVLIAVGLTALIALVVCHFVGVVDLSFVGDWAMSLGMMAADNAFVAALIFGGFSALGFGACYLLKDYIIGMEGKDLVVTNNTGTQYQPLGTNTPSTSGTVVNS